MECIELSSYVGECEVLFRVVLLCFPQSPSTYQPHWANIPISRYKILIIKIPIYTRLVIGNTSKCVNYYSVLQCV